MIPTIVCVPLGLLAMIACAIHLLGPARMAAPASRRRIRQANGLVMLVAIPMLTIGFGVIDPTRAPGVWMLTWIAAIALLTMAIGLAMLDAFNTMRLHHLARRDLRGALDRMSPVLPGRRGPRLVADDDAHEA